jgi:hypothetical protein
MTTSETTSQPSSPLSKKMSNLVSTNHSTQIDVFHSQNEIKKPSWMIAVYEAFCAGSDINPYPLNSEIIEFFVCEFLDKV